MKKIKLLLTPILRNFPFSQDLLFTADENKRVIDSLIYRRDKILSENLKALNITTLMPVAGLRIFK